MQVRKRNKNYGTQEEMKIWKAAKLGDQKAREELLLLHTPFALSLVRRIPSNPAFPSHIDKKDLRSEAMIMLLVCIDNFSLDREVAFSSYAGQRILGAITDNLRKAEGSGPRGMRQMQRKIELVEQGLSHKLGRKPLDAEIAKAMSITLEDLFGHRLSFDQAYPLYLDEERDEKSTLADSIEDQEALGYVENIVHECSSEILQEGIRLLTKAEQEVVQKSFFENVTLKEIGASLGISESRVSQIRTKALKKMENSIGNQLAV